MIVVDTPHPPGAVCMATGEIARYATSLQHYHRLQVPNGSLDAWHAGVLVAENLNQGLEAMMGRPTLQWAWIMGDDHTYPADFLLRLLDRQVDVIAPLCVNRYPPMDPSIVSASLGRQRRLEEMPTTGLYKLASDETCGDAGLLIRRPVLEALARPFYDARRSGSFKSEDQAFTRKIQDAGFPIWIDCDHTIGHMEIDAVQPVAVDGQWRIRITGGHRHIVDIAPRPGSR